MQVDMWERAEELKRVRKELPDEVNEHRKHGISNALKKMLPAGTVEMAAMIDKDGKVIADGWGMAQCLK